jgi:hypothetical protein
MGDATPVPVPELPFIDWFYRQYGPNWTLGLLVTIVLIAIAWQVWQTIRKDREINKAIQAKDETISRLAEENRLYRIQVFKKLDWTDDQIDRWILNNESPFREAKEVKKKKP